MVIFVGLKIIHIMKKLTFKEKEKFKQHHIVLHKSFNELLSIYLLKNPVRTIRNTNLSEFLQWSYAQTVPK